MYETYAQDRAHIPVIQTPTPYRKNSYKHTAEEEDKPAGRNFMGTDPLGHALDPYRAGFRGKSKRLSARDRDMRIPNKTCLLLQQSDMCINCNAAQGCFFTMT